MNETKKGFAAKCRRKGVSDPTEIARRWRQHLQSPGSASTTLVGRGAYGTRIPAAPRLRGRGNYSATAGRLARTAAQAALPKGSFASAGARVGGALGGPLGGAIGRFGGGLIAKLSGMGDYQIRHNSVMQGMSGISGSQASFSSTGSSEIRVQRRECIGVINAPTDPHEYNTTRFRIQASNADLFPWGANVAMLFQEYEIMGCVFTLESTFSNYSAAGPLGSVVIATQYNAADRPFADIDAMLNSAYRTAGNPSESLGHGLECDPSLQSAEKLLVRNHSNSYSAAAPNNYDFGFLTVATQGLPAAAADGQIGRLYVTYDIKYSLPRIKDPILAYRNRLGGIFCCGSKASSCTETTGTVNVAYDNNNAANYWYGGNDTNNVFLPTQACDLHNNELSLGSPSVPEDVVLFKPSLNGDNVPWYEPGSLDIADQLVWVCGTPHDCLAQNLPSVVHMNFRFGGWVEIAFNCDDCTYTGPAITPPVVAQANWELPVYSLEGADLEDCNHESDLPPGISNFPPAPTAAGRFSLSVRILIKFQDSAPRRIVSFKTNPNCSYAREGAGSTTAPVPRWSIRMLGSDKA